MIDRLLARPEYGERWARHWLDVVGYADSAGYDDADMPFDRFLMEQLAGDELIGFPKPGQLTSDEIDTLAATGFLRMAPDGTAGTKDAAAKKR